MVEIEASEVKSALVPPLFIAAAEVFASLAVWHGTPSDWVGEPLHFWAFEVLRLQYWFGFCLVFATFWVMAWMSLRRRSATLALGILGAVCSFGTEVLTSIYFWKKLSLSQVNYLGWPDLRRYALEHVISWAVILLFGATLWYFRNRRKTTSGTS